MNEPTLTDTEREAWLAGLRMLTDAEQVVAEHTTCSCPALLDMTQAAHVARKLADVGLLADLRAVDRERAAWATKIETLASRVETQRSEFSPDALADKLRGLLAADDTEGKA